MPGLLCKSYYIHKSLTWNMPYFRFCDRYPKRWTPWKRPKVWEAHKCNSHKNFALLASMALISIEASFTQDWLLILCICLAILREDPINDLRCSNEIWPQEGGLKRYLGRILFEHLKSLRGSSLRGRPLSASMDSKQRLHSWWIYNTLILRNLKCQLVAFC